MKTLAVLFLASVFVFTSCKKDGVPPTLPPAESMVMDFKAFGGGQFKDEVMKSAMDSIPMDSSMSNFSYAKGNADFWNFIVFVTLAVPVSSYYAAFTAEPVQLDKNVWQWTKEYQSMGATYTARLVGTDEDNQVKFEMFVTKKGILGFSEVKWYEGTMSKSGNSGDWILYENPNNPVQLLKVNWTKNDAGKVGSIKYTYVKEKDAYGANNAFFGSYIEYGVTQNTLDRFYNIFVYDIWSAKMVNVNVEWSSTGYNGHVKADNHFSDANWHCWNNEGYNISCE